jgi:hypothetical protein
VETLILLIEQLYVVSVVRLSLSFNLKITLCASSADAVDKLEEWIGTWKPLVDKIYLPCIYKRDTTSAHQRRAKNKKLVGS